MTINPIAKAKVEDKNLFVKPIPEIYLPIPAKQLKSV